MAELKNQVDSEIKNSPPSLNKPDSGHLPLAALWPHDHIDLAAEAGQHPHEAFDGYVAEMALEDAGHIGLANPCDLGGGRLRHAAPGHHVFKAHNKLRLE